MKYMKSKIIIKIPGKSVCYKSPASNRISVHVHDLNLDRNVALNTMSNDLVQLSQLRTEHKKRLNFFQIFLLSTLFASFYLYGCGVRGKIAFTSYRGGNYDIYIMNAKDGSEQTNLTNDPARDENPAWSPDGSQIAFSSKRDDYFDIYVMNADGSGQTRLTHATNGANPVWSPDGLLIAFKSSQDLQSLLTEIYVMNAADGSGLRNLSNSPAQEDFPTWSPDGSRVAFQSNRDGNWEIYVMNAADGSDQRNLTTNTHDDTYPAWSPDGSRIAFVSLRDGNYEIYVMNADGSGQTRLTEDSSDDMEPTWSHDGLWIAFSSNRDPYPGIYRMNAAGSRLTRYSVSGGEPVWQP
jgi:Tol biopolymer transport system component